MKLTNNNSTSKQKCLQIKYYSILIVNNPGLILDYKYKDDLKLGSIVYVPLGNKIVIGCVWSRVSTLKKLLKIKHIDTLANIEPIDKNTRDFVSWVAQYTLSSLGLVLKMVISNQYFLKPNFIKLLIVNSKDKSVIKSKKQQEVIRCLSEQSLTLEEVTKKKGVSKNIILSMVKSKKLLEINSLSEEKKAQYKKTKPTYTLNNEQVKAFSFIKENIKLKKLQPIFLDGVTGSGKTELYFEVINEFIRNNKQILILLPEIALSKQWLNRFKKRFSFEPILWNSSLSKKEKKRSWRLIIKGNTGVVVGTRSALFLPFINLGLIIVDEEHDLSYKQEEGIIYNARDMAIVRAKISLAFIILVSATPSLETYKNVLSGKYSHVKIKKRYGLSKLPTNFVINMKDKKSSYSKWISDQAINEIRKTLNKNQQALIFLNRRGYAPVSICKKCAYRFNCKNCDSWLVKHQKNNLLICHHCGYNIKEPKLCPSCGKSDSIISYGPGVERISEEIRKLFPGKNIETLSSDTINNKTFYSTLNKIEENQTNIIIGTQVISKGYNFPHITKVIIIDFDLSLYGGDLRAAEKTFQLISQVSGRAGRGKKPGEVFIQTFDINNPIIDYLVLNDRDSFLKQELIAREQSKLPPFIKLVSLIVYGKDKLKVESMAKSIRSFFINNENIKVLGPVPSPISFLRGNYRYRLLIKTNSLSCIRKIIREIQLKLKWNNTVRLKVDVDPYSFM